MCERFTMKLLSLISLVAGLAAAQGVPPGVTLDLSKSRPLYPAPQSSVQSAPPRKDIPAIAKAANGAIVSIVMSDKDGHPIAQGSGFLVSKDGLIVTNYHVIGEGSSAVVKLPEGAFFAVDGVVAFDKARDVAVIKAHGKNFRTLTLGNSDRLQVGEEVVAIGNPLSLESTVSNGIVSGIRTIKEEGGKYLQITSPISPGSSGGPLFNMAGEVVGITTLYLKGGENLNFAIPINDAKHLLLGNVSKLKDLPNEEVDSGAERSSGSTGAACSFLISRFSAALPQSPTLCEEDPSTTGEKKVSVFSPSPVLGGALRRAWSTALFQTLQAAAIDGPCQRGCSVSVLDSQMASAGVRYETYISKENQTVAKNLLQQFGGFGSDEAYFFEWSELLNGTRINYPLNENNTKYLVNTACQSYLRLLRENPLLSDELRSSSKNFPSLPTCSVMMTTASSVYILVDFPNSFMPMFSYFFEPLPDAFHSLGRYEGTVIFRGPWLTYNDGTKGRCYRQYPLHWLGFIHDETSSGVRTEPQSIPLLTGHWVERAGQSNPHSLFATNDKAGTFVMRDTTVYRIVPFGVNSQIQLTDGTEWTLSADSQTHCGLSVGDEVWLTAIKSAEAEDHISVTKGNCKLNATFVGAW